MTEKRRITITLRCPHCGEVRGEIRNADPDKQYETGIFYCKKCSAHMPRPAFNKAEFNEFMAQKPKNHLEALAMAKRLEERNKNGHA